MSDENSEKTTSAVEQYVENQILPVGPDETENAPEWIHGSKIEGIVSTFSAWSQND